MITPVDGSQPVVTAENSRLVENTLHSCVLHCQKRMKARKAEEESYRIARESVYGWKTEKVFSQNAVFEDEDFDDVSHWWQRPELSKEKKAEKMKQADREVKFQLTNNQSKFSNNNFASASQNQTEVHAGQSNRYFPYSRDTRRCRRCHIIGHIAESCKVSEDRLQHHQRPSFSGQQGQGPAHSK